MPPGTSKQMAEYFEANPEILHGMVCFDILVGNNDRRPENLLLASDDHVWLIDHGNALLYRPTGNHAAGVSRLREIRESLHALFDKPHHFLSAVRSRQALNVWCDRIAALPDYFVSFIVETLPPGLLTAEERRELVQFLNERKRALKNLIAGHEALFPSLEGA